MTRRIRTTRQARKARALVLIVRENRARLAVLCPNCDLLVDPDQRDPIVRMRDHLKECLG